MIGVTGAGGSGDSAGGSAASDGFGAPLIATDDAPPETKLLKVILDMHMKTCPINLMPMIFRKNIQTRYTIL